MKAYDIVYILKMDAPSEELKYSLRSVEKNLKHGKVWFYCGQPKGLFPDRAVCRAQKGFMKWEKARSSVRSVCKNDEITEKFWLFNDDFFLLKPLTDETPLFEGLLKDKILNIEHHYGDKKTGYSKQLRMCEELLKEADMTTFDYALHVPMLIDRKKMLEAIETFPECPMFRSIYGNYAEIGGRQHDDNKIISLDKEFDEDADFVSTNDISFRNGKVGKQIREMFKERCKYEQAFRKTIL